MTSPVVAQNDSAAVPSPGLGALHVGTASVPGDVGDHLALRSVADHPEWMVEALPEPAVAKSMAGAAAAVCGHGPRPAILDAIVEGDVEGHGRR